MAKILVLLFFTSTLYAFGQHQDKVDFTHAQISIYPVPEEKIIKGNVTYTFKTVANVDSVFLDAKNMEFKTVLLNKQKVKFNNDGKKLVLKQKFKKGKTYVITLKYVAKPKQTVYFLGWDDDFSGNEQVWTQGQGKYTSHWLPSFDDMNEKVTFDLKISFDEGYEVIANGKLVSKKIDTNKTIDWTFDMQKPMSSYLLAFVIGKYNKQELISASGIPIENYYYPKDSLRAEPTYRHTKDIFDFMETEIGVPYPWQNYKQVPVHDFLYAGMENTGTTIFSDGYVIDSTAFIDKNYVNVNAHELAHQWFGDLVTEESGNHHWLHEGFATYYAYLVEKKIFGDDYFYWKLYNSALQLNALSKEGKGESLTNPKASSLTFYEKGAWALFILQEKIGNVAFKKGIKTYLKKYQFKNVTITDFLSEMELASEQDLLDFKKEWLDHTEFPFEEVKSVLRKQDTSLDVLFLMEEELQKSQSDAFDYNAYWDKSNSVHFKKHILGNYNRVINNKLWDSAFDSDTIPIRQMTAIKLDSIPLTLKTKFEPLLEDKSYITKENALFKLWATFPAERARYLEKTKGVYGLPNKNVRLLWLTLAILTNDYRPMETPVFFEELSGYTSPEYGWEVRLEAFQYLNQALGFNDESLKNLIEASTHHSWQFKKIARNLIDKLLKDEAYKIRLKALSERLEERELRYIKSKLDIE